MPYPPQARAWGKAHLICQFLIGDPPIRLKGFQNFDINRVWRETWHNMLQNVVRKAVYAK
jgi:hypothetical protein